MKTKPKTIKAWAVVVSEFQLDCGGEFRPFGNGKQYQWPIFPTRKDAKEWRNEFRTERGRIIPILITLNPKVNKKKQ